jgi:DNA-binding NtrC family response regulator
MKVQLMDRIHILIVDDEPSVRGTLAGFLADLGHEVLEAGDGREALEVLPNNRVDLVLTDLMMPRMDGISLLGRLREEGYHMPVVIVTGQGTMDTAIDALRLGAADFLTKPVSLAQLEAVLEKAMRLRTLERQARRLEGNLARLQNQAERREGFAGVIGPSPAACRVREEIRVAVEGGCDTVLVSGDTGTGKEVVARAIHRAAFGDGRPFYALNCPSIPDSLLESELFGHRKGAFTGAGENRPGAFELADNGTLLLDEVGELSERAQASLLRVLETRCVRRIGGQKERPVTVRLVAATNVPLEKLVETGDFRRDLYYRLNLFHIQLQPLRERPEDILPLAHHFLEWACSVRDREVMQLSPEAETALRSHPLPGNARQLRNVIERAVIVRSSGTIVPADLALPAVNAESDPSAIAPAGEKERLTAALEQSRWNRKEAARLLGIPYSTLRYKIHKHGL